MGAGNWKQTIFKNLVFYVLPCPDDLRDEFQYRAYIEETNYVRMTIDHYNEKLCYLEFELIDGYHEGVQLDIKIKEQDILNDATYYEDAVLIEDIKKDILNVIKNLKSIAGSPELAGPGLLTGYDNYPLKTTTVDFNDKEVQEQIKEGLYTLVEEMLSATYELNSPFGDDEVFAKKIVDEALTIYFNKPNDKEAKLTNSL